MTAPVQPNKELARAFLASLPHERVNIWAQDKTRLDDKGKPLSKGWIIDPHDADAVSDVLSKLTRQHDVYFSLNEPYSEKEIAGLGLTRKDGSPIRFNKKIRDDMVKRVRFLAVDLDPKDRTKEEIRDAVDLYVMLQPMAPTHVIDSGSGYWMLWEVPSFDEISVPLVKGWNQRIAAALGGDDAAVDASRVARLPGFVNNKFDPGRVAHVVKEFSTGALLNLSVLDKEFGGVAIKASSKSSAGLTPEQRDARRKQAAELAVPVGERALIRDAIDAIHEDHESTSDYGLWRNHIWAIVAGHGGDAAAALDDAYAFSQKLLLRPDDWELSTEARIDEYDPAHDGTDGKPITVKTLFNTAKACGWDEQEARKRLLSSGQVRRAHNGRYAERGTVIPVAEAADYFADTYFLCDKDKFYNAAEDLSFTTSKWLAMHDGVKFLVGYDAKEKPIYHGNPLKLFLDTVRDTNYIDGEGFHVDYPYNTVFVEDGRTLLNKYKRVERTVTPGADVTPFLDLLKTLYPDDWKWLVNYFRHLAQKPGQKVRHAPVLQGAQGCGKNTITGIARYIVGEKQYSEISQAHLDGRFNGFLDQKLLVVINDLEIKNGLRCLGDLKTLVSDDHVVLESKGQNARLARNFMSLMITTNHKNAVSIKDGDRRYWPLFSAMQTKDDMTRAGFLDADGNATDFFVNFNAWLRDGGYAAIYSYVMTTEIEEGYEMTGRAPITSAMSEATRTPGGVIEEIIFDALEEGAPGFNGPVLRVGEVVDYVRAKVGRQIPPRMVTAVLDDRGFTVKFRVTHDQEKYKDLFGVKKAAIVVHRGACFRAGEAPDVVPFDRFALGADGTVDHDKALKCYLRYNTDDVDGDRGEDKAVADFDALGTPAVAGGNVVLFKAKGTAPAPEPSRAVGSEDLSFLD